LGITLDMVWDMALEQWVLLQWDRGLVEFAWGVELQSWDMVLVVQSWDMVLVV
jgi:hypothetical protein